MIADFTFFILFICTSSLAAASAMIFSCRSSHGRAG